MNILFLDFDGVLNTPLPIIDNITNIQTGKELLNNTQAINILSNFCISYKYDIVVSSSISYIGLEYCRDILSKSGLDSRVNVIDIVPEASSKAISIRNYIKFHPDVINIIILDDDNELCKTFKSDLVLCNPLVGLTMDEHLKLTMKALK